MGSTPRTSAIIFSLESVISVFAAYNPNATQDPFNNQFSATSNSMAILYDVSGNKNPNTNGKDIGKINVTELAGTTGCMIPELADTMCITQILADTGYSPMTLDECNQAVQEGKLGIKACNYDDDYWAGAVKVCEGTQNMPTQDQLTALAEYIYPDAEAINSSGMTNANWNADRAAPFIAQSPYTDRFYVWSGQDYDYVTAHFRDFFPTNTLWNGSTRTPSNRFAVCVSN